jgi:hypothetical protein
MLRVWRWSMKRVYMCTDLKWVGDINEKNLAINLHASIMGPLLGIKVSKPMKNSFISTILHPGWIRSHPPYSPLWRRYH